MMMLPREIQGRLAVIVLFALAACGPASFSPTASPATQPAPTPAVSPTSIGLPSAIPVPNTPAASTRWPPEPGTLTAVAVMRHPRACHRLTLLPDGRVLVTGGMAGERYTATAELFDPATGAFTPTGDMHTPRVCHTAILLDNGLVLIAGGFNGGYAATAELYDPATGMFTPTGSLGTARSDHVAILLPDGRVLLAGGVGNAYTFLASAELYDPLTGTFAPTGSLSTPRESHTATLLADGQVLVAGGHQGRRSAVEIYASAELYDPATGLFTLTGAMTQPRHKHDAVRLADGRVLIVGGADERDDQGQFFTAEYYDPTTGAFSPAPDMLTKRYKFEGTSVLLRDGRVLLAGGAVQPELFDPAADAYARVRGRLDVARLFAAAVRLPDGQVLISGGYGPGATETSQAWLYSP